MAVAHVRLMILALLFAAGISVIVGRLALLALFAEPTQGADFVLQEHIRFAA